MAEDPPANPQPNAKSNVRWTDAQRAAIEHLGGDLIVSAAAGSGKTAVLAERCARLVCSMEGGEGSRCGVENLLVLTFTEAAAGEMRTRIGEAVADRLRCAGKESRLDPDEERWLRRQAAMIDRASISTLHAFCARVLRQHFHEAGVDPAFEVMDEDEARLLQDEVLDGLIARWHRLAPQDIDGAVTGGGFDSFFEAHAQGRESECARIILQVYRMLATTEDPDAFKRSTRRIYGEDAHETVRQYSQQTLMGRLKLARLVARRAYDEVRPLLDSDQTMVKGLQDAVLVIQDAIELLEDKGTKAWPFIVTQLTYKWMKLNRIDSISDFAGLKDRTWEEVKQVFKETAKLFTRDPAQMVQELKSLLPFLETLLAMVEQFERTYTDAKRADNRLDFADLEQLALNLLKSPTSHAAAELRERFVHVLVDEFQDINPLQAALLDAVRHPARFNAAGNLFVVGDVKQSIYGFRLADPELFLARERDALAADAASPERGRRHVALQENFRSQPALIEVMNGIFESILTPEVAGVDYTRGHALRAGKGEAPGRGAQGSDRTTLNGVPVEVHLVAPDADVTNDDNDEEEENGRENRSHEDENEEDLPTAAEMEARVVAQRIEQFIADGKTLRQKDGTLRKLEYRDIAVLVRSARTRGMIFARALSDRGIPVHADLASGFFDTPEVQHAMALLQVLDNPRQDIPLAAALLGPFGGFAHDDLAIVRLTFDRKEVSFAEAAQAYVSCDSRTRAQVAAAAGPVRYLLNDAPVFSEDLARRLTQFFAKLARWREMLHGRPLHEGLAEIFAESGIYTWLAALDTGPQRIANLQMLHQRALAFAGFKKQGLHRFLRFIERLRIQEEADGGEAPILSEASNVVRIMTIHKSKGLEFPVVFVSGLGSLLRLSDEGPVLLHRDLGVGLNMVDLDRNIHYPSASSLRIRDAKKRAARAEELRLLYVAITRARDMLVLTGHVRKADEVANWRKVWNTRSGPVPEDVLLKGRRAIDWVMPALVLASRRRNGALSVAWPGDSDNAAQALIALHRVTTTPVGRQATLSPDAQAVLAAQPLGGDTAGLESLIARVAGNYQFAAQAARPAVQTVSFLKTLAGQREVDEPEPAGMFDDPALDAEPASDAAVRETQIEAARLRGLATHRVLELLDLAQCASEAQLNEQVASLIAAKQLTDAERDRADWRGIKWFLWHSQSGARVLHAARAAAGGSTILRREIPFAWIGTIDPRPDIAEDIPTIRGVIDVLLVDRPQSRAEIIDYKTDSARLWQSRVNDYRRQMRYYMAAAGDILGMKVPRATLVFLAAKVEIVVEQEI